MYDVLKYAVFLGLECLRCCIPTYLFMNCLGQRNNEPSISCLLVTHLNQLFFRSLIAVESKVSPRKFVYIYYITSHRKCIQIFWDSLWLKYFLVNNFKESVTSMVICNDAMNLNLWHQGIDYCTNMLFNWNTVLLTMTNYATLFLKLILLLYYFFNVPKGCSKKNFRYGEANHLTKGFFWCTC